VWIIVGLGNPGEQYARTRHNIGFNCVTHLAQRHGLTIQKKRANAQIGEGNIGGQRVVLVKPMTYMNRSGLAVSELCHWYKVDPAQDLLVIYDDMDLPFGKLRIRLRGSAGTHNGMRSLVSQLGSQNFPRLRVGVGGRPDGKDACSHVLGTFRPEERAALPALYDLVSDAVETALGETIETAMNRYNVQAVVPDYPDQTS
jgi:peptidyl-tRNA hydrolase, PTH1 family